MESKSICQHFGTLWLITVVILNERNQTSLRESLYLIGRGFCHQDDSESRRAAERKDEAYEAHEAYVTERP